MVIQKLGFSSFVVNRRHKGRKYLTLKKFHYVVSTVVHAIVQILSFFVLLNIWEQEVGDNDFGDLLGILRRMEVCASYLSFLVFIICSKIYGKRIQLFWQSLYDMEIDLRKRGILLKQILVRRMAIGYLLGSVIAAVCTSLLNIAFNSEIYEYLILKLVEHIFYHFFCLSYVLLIGQHTLSCVVINIIFEALEETTKRIYLSGRRNIRYPNQWLLEIAKYHQRICRIAKQRNNAITIQLLFMFMHIFYSFAGSLYSATVFMINNIYDIRNIIVILWFAICLTSVIVIIDSAHKTTTKVSPSLI